MSKKVVKEMKQKDLKAFREKNLPERCPICNRKMTPEIAVLDHIHTSHKSMYPETFGLVRGVICRDCNVILGKIENQYLRSSREYKEQTNLPDILKNLASYILKYSKKENFDELLIHPSEVKSKIIKRSWFAKFRKEVKEKFNKTLEYPKSGKLTKQIEEYIKKLNYPTDDMYYK